MTELPASTWREIEQNAVMHDGQKQIGVGVLRNILKKSKRTPDQNSLLWALYDDAIKRGGEHLGGWSRDDVHEFMLGEYHGWEKLEAFGRVRLKPVKRSSRLTKMEFSDFVEFVVRKFAENGIVLKLPGEAEWRR